MKFRRLGSSNLEISVVGLGCWAIGGRKWGFVDDRESIETVQTALSLGVNFFDTADLYGFGHSEEVLGKALAGHPDAIIATKVGLAWNKKEKIRHDLSEKHITSACEASLKRLRRDTIDLYQIHWPDPQISAKEVIPVMNKLVEQGKVRYFGVSNFALGELKKACSHGRITSVQGKFNLFDQRLKEDIIPYCAEQSIGFIGYEPLFKGMLTGKFTEVPTFGLGDHRKYRQRFTARFEFYRSIVEELRDVAQEHDVTIGSMALALALKSATTIIPGAKSPGQISENAGAADIGEETLGTIEKKVEKCLEQMRL